MPDTSTGMVSLATALTPEGWRRDVLLTHAAGIITDIRCGTPPPAGALRLAGATISGLANLHSHAFQRGMAGLAERGPGDGDFWSWRGVMYRYLDLLTPDDIEAITALAYMEMLEAGFTAVAEFHYLHNPSGGGAYDAVDELAGRIAAAAAETGIGFTLLPVFYAHAGFDDRPLDRGQQRFVQTLDRFAALVEACAGLIRQLPAAALGIAPHSLRAVRPDELAALVGLAGRGPLHIHAAEQTREVEESVAALGARPVEWLLDHAPVDSRWCLVHATHLTDRERRGLAASGAVAGLCPITESNLGDGIFPLVDYVAEAGRFGIGTDSNVLIGVAAELRTLEYSQRLRDRRRSLLRATADAARSTGANLLARAAAGGAQALGRRCGVLEIGAAADLVVLDPEDPALVGRSEDTLLDSWIFASGGTVRDVLVGGRHLVADGRHIRRAPILARWRKTALRLSSAL